MTAYLFLPMRFLVFWFLEAPLALLLFFRSYNGSLLHVLSIPLCLRTFFRPLKNEYRSGLVGFSIGLGIFVKTIILICSTVIFSCILVLEALMLIGFVLLPIGTILLLWQ